MAAERETRFWYVGGLKKSRIRTPQDYQKHVRNVDWNILHHFVHSVPHNHGLSPSQIIPKCDEPTQ
jgi:hypothetical protein